jgi:hypothetical protein
VEKRTEVCLSIALQGVDKRWDAHAWFPAVEIPISPEQFGEWLARHICQSLCALTIDTQILGIGVCFTGLPRALAYLVHRYGPADPAEGCTFADVFKVRVTDTTDSERWEVCDGEE